MEYPIRFYLKKSCLKVWVEISDNEYVIEYFIFREINIR